MADQSIRKVSQPGIGYSVVHLHGVPHVYATAMPLSNGNFHEQAADVLQMLEGVITHQGVRHSIVQQAVFLADMTNLGRCRQLMEDFYGPHLPAISYIPQPPCGGKLLAIEAVGAGQDRDGVEIRRVSPELAIARQNGITWFDCTQMSAIALATDRGDVSVVPLQSPRQTAAFDYSSADGPKSSQFSRAIAVSYGEFAKIFLSAAASVADPHARRLDDAVRQTEETLDNIAALIDEDNLSQSGLPGLGASLAGLGLARVYIKRPEDFPAVRAVCRRRLGTVPTTYAIADILSQRTAR